MQKQQLLQRAGILQSPVVAGIALGRETATLQKFSPVHSKDIKARVYGSTIQGHLLELPDPFSRTKIHHFAYDKATRGFLIGAERHGDNFIEAVTLNTSIDQSPKDGSKGLPEGRSDSRYFARSLSSNITSISISPSRVAAITTFGDRGPSADIFFYTLSDPATQLPGAAADFDTATLFNHTSHSTVYTSAPNSFLGNSEAVFAVGTAKAIIIFAHAQSQWSHSQTLALDSSAFAVEWQDATTIAMGLHNGGVKLWDTRRGGSSLRFQHPSCAAGNKRVDANRLVVCGLQNSMAMYDLRMTRENNESPPSSKPASYAISTRPLVNYPYHNSFWQFVGFDISTDLGLVAASGDRDPFQMFSLETGLPAGPSMMEEIEDSTIPNSGVCSCLQFVRHDNKDVLYATQYGELWNYYW